MRKVMFPVTENFHSNRKSYKRNNRGKPATLTHGVIDECTDAVFDSDKSVSSDVVKICNAVELRYQGLTHICQSCVLRTCTSDWMG